jgi:polysaccharide biosynthesis protein PslA
MSSGAPVGVWANTTPRFTKTSNYSRQAVVHADLEMSSKDFRHNETSTVILSGLALTLADGQPVIQAPGRSVTLALKRGIDMAISLFGLIILSPALLVIAIAIKITSPGPILFRQTRAGLGGKPFAVLKFRSMHNRQCEAACATQVTNDDPRVTPMGRFMRRNNIDELPQLINIFKGEMSLVGPRPHTFDTEAAGRRYEELVPYYHLRETMKPGLSGWAQVNGYRGETSDAIRARARIDHDLAYIANFSILLDLRVVVLTLIRETIRGSGS